MHQAELTTRGLPVGIHNADKEAGLLFAERAAASNVVGLLAIGVRYRGFYNFKVADHGFHGSICHKYRSDASGKSGFLQEFLNLCKMLKDSALGELLL
jgi:hypothetical protein